jgi:hypothetical protein
MVAFELALAKDSAQQRVFMVSRRHPCLCASWSIAQSISTTLEGNMSRRFAFPPCADLRDFHNGGVNLQRIASMETPSKPTPPDQPYQTDWSKVHITPWFIGASNEDIEAAIAASKKSGRPPIDELSAIRNARKARKAEEEQARKTATDKAGPPSADDIADAILKKVDAKISMIAFVIVIIWVLTKIF